MKRLPLIFSLLAVIALSGSVAYWGIELYKPKERPLAPTPQAAIPEPSTDAGATLFGGEAVTVAVSNYQLTGVVSAGANGVAILVADGQPPKAVQVGKDVVRGVTLKEVHPKHVMLSEGGMLKRIELATDDKAATMGGVSPVAAVDPAQQQLQMQMQLQQQQLQQQQLQQQQMQQMQQQQQMQQMQQQQQPQPMPVPQDLPGANVPVQPNQNPESPESMPQGMPAPPPPTQMPQPTRMGGDNNPKPAQ